MWPFRSKKKEKRERAHALRRIVVGLIIGGAVTSIIGKKVLEKHDKAENQDTSEEKKNDPTQE